MLYRPLLISVIALGLTACFGESYENYSSGPYEEIPPRVEPSLPDSGVVQNGNLEESTTEAIGWNGYANSGTATFELSTEQYYTGAQSFKVSIEAAGDNLWDIGAGPVAVPVEEFYTYHFSAWVLGTNGAIANFTAQLEESPWTALGSQQIEITSSWQKVAFSFEVPAGVTSIQLPAQLSDELNNGAVIYIDHASLKGEAPRSEVVDIPIEPGLAGWSPDWRSNTLSYDADRGVVIEPDWANDDQIAMYTIEAPKDFNGTTIYYVLDIPQEFIDAGISLQPYVQQNSGSYDADWSQWVDKSSLTEGTFIISYNVASAPVDTQRIALQIKGEGRSFDPVENISIERIYYAEESGGSDVPLDSGWTVSTDLTVDYSDAGVSYSPTAADHQLYYTYAGPQNFDGSKFTFSIKPSQEFIDSGANIQPYAQLNSGTGEWGCWINGGANLTTDGISYECTVEESGAFDFDDTDSMKIGIQVKEANSVAPTGTLTITDIQID